MKMKKNLLKMALLAFATFAASVASAQSTYVLYGNVGEGEVKLSTTRDKASDGTMTVSDYSENDQVVGFTQTITEQGKWFLSYDWFGSEIDPVILKGTEYNLVYDVRTSWSGDVKLKFEVQTKGATEKPVSFDHDGEWHTITIPVQSWVDANVLQAIESSSRVMFGFVGGNWNVTEPTTIDYRNVKLVPVNVVPDTEAPAWVSEPTVVASPTAATISVNAKDNISTMLKYEVSETEDFATLEASVSGKANEATEIALKGLSQKTDYTYYVRVKDMAGNAGESKTVKFTTEQAPDLEPLYLTIPIASKDWNNEAYNPNGSMLITVNPDNTLSFKVSLDQDREDFEETNMYVHGVEEPVSLIRTSEGVYECTTTKTISNRDALVHFHMYFRFSDGNSTFAVKSFTPSEGSTSAVAEVETEAAKVVAANGVIRVEGDKTFAVYTVAGQLAFRGMGEVRLDKGVYVVVVDGKAQKVML